MDTNGRIMAKALSWQGLGLCSMTALGYAFTGSLGEGGALAIASTAVGMVCYVLHEKLWARVRWGRRERSGRTSPQTNVPWTNQPGETGVWNSQRRGPSPV